MNFKPHDIDKEGSYVSLENGIKARWIQYQWLENDTLLSNGII